MIAKALAFSCLTILTLCSQLFCKGKEAVYFATGCKIGEVTQNSVVIWTRLTAEPERNWQGVVAYPHESPTRVMTEVPDFPVHLWEGSARGHSGQVRSLIATSPEFHQPIITPWVAVTAATDYSHQFFITGLEPDQRYYFCIQGRADEKSAITTSPVGSFATAPETNKIKNLWFAVSSCQMYAHRDDPNGFKIYPAMMRIYKSLPDFMVRLGDAVYYDRDNPRGKTIDLCRLHWQRMYSLPLLRDFHYRVPTYWMKDDHDTFFDDCWRTYQAPWIAPLTFEQGEQLFEEQTPSPPEGRRYRTFRWGKLVQLWLLESRSFRSANDLPDGPHKTLLGAEQKAWLQQTLLESDAIFKIILSPTAIVGPDNPDQEDNLADDAFFTEGNALRQWTRENNFTHLYVINGDRHWQYLSTDPQSGLREFSVGPSSDQHVLRGPGYDPKYHSFYRNGGGFLSVTIYQGEKKVLAKPQRIVIEDSVPTIIFRFHDVEGTLLYEYRDTALKTD